MATVLIADDSRVQLQLLTTWLRDAGYTVMAAMDCMQAWSVAVTTPPDAMVLDLNMPAGSGIEVLRKMKSSYKTAQIPVLVVTGSIANLESVARGMGAVGYLNKPVSFEQFSSEMAKLLPIS
jgi:CheY-like chemotaxis protein